MGQLSAKLRSTETGIAYYCPGCGRMQALPIGAPQGWEWDGDVEKPTIKPSIKTWHDGSPPYCCHSFVEAGMIRFLNDCTHALRGQTVPLPDLPLRYRDPSID